MRRPFTFRSRISAPVVVFLIAIALWLASSISPAAADGIIVPQPPRDRPIVVARNSVGGQVSSWWTYALIKDQVATTMFHSRNSPVRNEATFPVEGT